MPKGGRETDVSALASNPSLLARLKSAARYTISGVSPSAWMSPGQPIQPIADDIEPRVWDYPVGFNQQTATRRAIGRPTAHQLFSLVENCDLLNIIIERRKDQLESLPWQVRPRLDAKAPPDDPRIAEIETLLRFPDGHHDWNTWLRRLLDDHFVLDAVAIEKRRNRKGKLVALDLLPGETISLKIDQNGRCPLPPDPAYQQILKGVPAIDLTTDDLLYRARNLRRGEVYGRSVVETVLTTVNIAIRRATSQLTYYTDGNLSEGVFWLPPEWDTTKVKEFQVWWDSIHTGNDAERRRAKFLPGNKDSYQAIVQPPLKDEYDEWLARVICFAFAISPTPFVKQVNRATAESAQKAALEEGLGPLQDFIKGIIDQIIIQEYGFNDLEFTWKDDTEQDPLVAAQIRKSDVSAGIISIDEARSDVGRDPFGGTASKPGIVTPTGWVPLPSEDAIEAQDEAVVAGSQAAAEFSRNPPEPEPIEGEPATDHNDQDTPPAKGAKAEKGAGGNALGKKWSNPLATPTARTAIASIHKRVSSILSHTGHHAAAQLRGMHLLGKADETDEDRAKRYADQIDLSNLDDVRPVSASLSDVATDVAQSTLSTLKIDDSGLFGQVSQRSVDWAQDHAAKLVSGMTDTTRDMIRQTIAAGLADKDKDIGAIADDLQRSYAFSGDRAELIAHTETANASGQGSLTGYRAARDTGLKIKKRWLDDPTACPICVENALAGPIDIDDEFPSGDNAPAAHPRCSCTTIAVIET